MGMTLRESYQASKVSREIAALTPMPAPMESAVQVPITTSTPVRKMRGPSQEDACVPFCGKQVNVLVNGSYQYVGLLETVNIYSITLKRQDTGRSVVLFKNGMIAMEEAE